METNPAVFQPVTLPYGLWRDGTRLSMVAVRPISGHDEMALDEAFASGASIAHAGNLLIGRCVGVLAGQGACTPMGRELAGALTLGDREILFRALYAASVSRSVAAGLLCPTCGQMIAFDLDLSITPELPPEPGPLHTITIVGRDMTCRVLTGTDLEIAAHTADPLNALHHACTDEAALSADVLARELTRLDPNAETVITLTCAECGEETQAFLDGFELIRRAITADGGIFSQVHCLATAYGWREDDILAIPRARRRRYCSMAHGAKP